MRNRVIDFLLYSVVPLIPIAILAAVSLWCYRQCGDGDGETPADTVSVVRNEVHDTVYVEVHDTVPQLVTERVVRYVKVPVILEHEDSDVLQNSDSVNMAVVQRTYSDDSTYTAYVSGLLYQDLPKLDSITVRQRTVTNTVTEIVTLQRKVSRWGVGVQAGCYMTPRGVQPGIGIGISYNIFPP